MKCTAVVAHPDDCVIFAWPVIQYLSGHDWSIIYLTYSQQNDRAREMKNFWKKRNVNTVFLGYTDDYRDIESNRLSFDSVQAAQDLLYHCRNFDLIVTHNSDGEYGHPHHRFVHDTLSGLDVPKIYFAINGNHNWQTATEKRYDLDELPLHRDVVEGFCDRFAGRYFVNQQAEKVINNG